MKPSERIQELCVTICNEHGAASPTSEQLLAAMVEAILQYLDEVAAGPQDPADP